MKTHLTICPYNNHPCISAECKDCPIQEDEAADMKILIDERNYYSTFDKIVDLIKENRRLKEELKRLK